MPTQLKTLLKHSGGSEAAQALTQMIVNMVIGIAIMVVLVVLSGGAATMPIAAKLAEMVAPAVGLAERVCETIIRVSMITVQVAMTLAAITLSSVNMNNKIQLSYMDVAKGDAESYSEKVQVIIAALKKAIAKLFELLQSSSDKIVTISDAQGKKWTDASQISTDLMG